MSDQSLLLLLDEVRGKTLRLLQGVVDEEARWCPPELHNHVLWHAGHSFVLVESLAMEAVGELPQIPEGWFEIFSWKSNPAQVEPYRWPPLAQVISQLTGQHARLRRVIDGLSDEQLSRPLPGRGDHTARYAILHGLHDEACHSGEIWLLRKLIRSATRKRIMTLSRQKAFDQLRAWTANPSLLGHARAVEIVMRAAACKYGGDPEVWGTTGLLHDADYDQWPEDHPQRIVDWLREQGEEDMAYAVSFHQTKWNLPPKTAMDKCLLACDELTGFVIACCLVRPDGIATLEPKSVKKKLKDKAFAAKVDREIIRSSVELLDVDFDEHLQFVIDALKPHAEELGIAGKH